MLTATYSVVNMPVCHMVRVLSFSQTIEFMFRDL